MLKVYNTIKNKTYVFVLQISLIGMEINVLNVISQNTGTYKRKRVNSVQRIRCWIKKLQNARNAQKINQLSSVEFVLVAPKEQL